ncbi:MAG: Crp/Fnr family transcriptional regulator, partial [Candidatus Binatia bacterium]
GLGASELEEIRRRGQVRALAADDPVLQEGDANAVLFVVLRGELDVFLPKSDERPTRVHLGVIGAGECVGEYSFVDEKPASASVTARDPAEIFSIAKADFEALVAAQPAIGRDVYRNVLGLAIARLRSELREIDVLRLPGG